MPATYEKIATLTGTGSSDTLTLTSIPATYTDLVLVLNGSLNTAANVYMRMNNLSTAIYSQTVLSGDGSSASSYRHPAAGFSAFIYMGYADTGITNYIIQFMNYSNTTTKKSAIHRHNNAGGQVSTSAMLWDSTAAISRIDLITSNGATWSSATTANLYGILKA